tara:strand:- start:142 stop:330 length:189 start_codon:yes stop_codon:yes gene_type:complete
MRKKDYGKRKGFAYAMLSKDLYPILEMNNIGRNKSHRIALAPSWGGARKIGREEVIKLLMST